MQNRRDSKRTLNLPPLPRTAAGEAQLKAIFRKALQEAVAPSFALGLLAACGREPISVLPMGDGGTDQRTSPQQTRFEARACVGMDADARWDPMPNVNPGVGVDYLAFFPYLREMTSSRGEPCATATDAQACEAALAEAQRFENTCGPPGCAPFLVITNGNEGRRLETADAVAGVLAPIDTPDEAALVAYFSRYHVACGNPKMGGVKAVQGGYQVSTSISLTDCPITTEARIVMVDRDGKVTVVSTGERTMSSQCVGRRPAGLDPVASDPRSLPGFLAACARLEAASVPAFLLLARDLGRLGAPEELVAEAVRSAHDEVRHADVVTRLCRARGGSVLPSHVAPVPPPDLLTLALENAREGCVRETFGALAGAYQARAAADTEIAAAMGVIADDEARHAALAWQIARWIETQLTSEERARVREARRQAVEELAYELMLPLSEDVYTQAGWPVPAEALRMHASLVRDLWAQA